MATSQQQITMAVQPAHKVTIPMQLSRPVLGTRTITVAKVGGIALLSLTRTEAIVGDIVVIVKESEVAVVSAILQKLVWQPLAWAMRQTSSLERRIARTRSIGDEAVSQRDI